MVIFGVDPGTARMGWAVIESEKGKLLARTYGCLTTPKESPPEKRLASLHKELRSLIKTHKPNFVSVEDLFFATNAKTAISVGQARGIILLAAAQLNIRVASYSPLAIKRMICGIGNADKKLVQKAITKLFHLREVPKPDDCADALAVAVAHVYALNGEHQQTKPVKKKAKKS